MIKILEALGSDYDDSKYINSIALAKRIADYVGTDATDDEIWRWVNDIVDEEYGDLRLNGRRPEWNATKEDVEQAISQTRQKVFDGVKKEIERNLARQEEDPMEGHKYRMSCSHVNWTETGYDHSFSKLNGYYDDPKSAIVAWLRASEQYPTEAAIMTNKNKYADELLGWVDGNQDLFRQLCKKYNCPYKVDYLIDICNRGNNHDFEKNKYNYEDQIYPFCIG